MLTSRAIHPVFNSLVLEILLEKFCNFFTDVLESFDLQRQNNVLGFKWELYFRYYIDLFEDCVKFKHFFCIIDNMSNYI